MFCTQVATFILQKILLDETGLGYICQTYERFSHVAMILVSGRAIVLSKQKCAPLAFEVKNQHKHIGLNTL